MTINAADLTTTVEKRKSGWQAKTVIRLPGVIEDASTLLSCDEPGAAQLEITTTKHDSGFATSAGVDYKTDYGFRTKLSFISGDFHRTVRSRGPGRATEKAVREYHLESLTYIEQVLAAVAEHYGVNPLAELESA